jgi:DNA-binding NarL/FixJ family response regulator
LPTRPKQTRKKWSRARSRQRAQNLEELVKAGVERFMLKDSTIEDFMKALRSTEKRVDGTPHPLTRDVFSRIVKEAVLKKKRGASRRKLDEHTTL